MSCRSNGQEKIIHHEYSLTASSWNVLEWNVKNPNEKRCVIRETLDSKGRVTMLEFLKDGKLITDNLCYLANKVVFEYGQNQIIETLYNSEKQLLATDCEMWYKSIYHLNKENNIEKIERFSKYDFTNISPDEIEKWKTEWAPAHRIEKPDSTMLQIEYFYHSFGKMSGIYPVSKNYVLDEESYYFRSEPEKTSIKNGLKN
jgi:hypothetical protein